MPAITANDLARMHDGLLFDGEERGRKLSGFWALLTLAAIIATAGIVSDSTATVIGAMIVAPLMTPILGTVLSVVTGDGHNLLRCLLLVVCGALTVILVGYLIGLVVPVPVDAATNSQVSSRVNPTLMDLFAALASGRQVERMEALLLPLMVGGDEDDHIGDDDQAMPLPPAGVPGALAQHGGTG